MKDSAALARGWIRKGDNDLADARRTVDSAGPYDTACFHAQQAAEKYLKALLGFHGRDVPRTHDLEEIQKLCESLASDSPLLSFDLTDLTGYAVALRYDQDFWPDLTTAGEAVEVAERVRSSVLALLPDDAHP